MATTPSGMRLDSPPPLPPELAMTQAPQPRPSPTMDGLMPPGMMGSGEVASGAALGLAMQIEQGVTQLTQMLPEFAPAADQIVSLLRTGVMQAVQKTATAATSAPMPMMGMTSSAPPLNTGGGAVATP